MDNIKDLISIDADVLGGQAVFKGTRVPVETLFDYIEAGYSLEEFLVEFESVKKEQIIAVMEVASKSPTSVFKEVL
jgi:uncharacterized protein (DUF433 family)